MKQVITLTIKLINVQLLEVQLYTNDQDQEDIASNTHSFWRICNYWYGYLYYRLVMVRLMFAEAEKNTR